MRVAVSGLVRLLIKSIIFLIMDVPKLIRSAELFLISCIALGTALFFIFSIGTLMEMDWSQSDTFFFLIRRILALIIGIELVRFIYTYKIETLLEIIIFLLARQLILIEIEGTHEYLLPTVLSVSVLLGLHIAHKKFVK
ncbi:hypothetical protein KC851_03965 [Candidatus Kaiserbacteria bacterium]|nr:hypothetical protein [Candidatus Kaiserbacteria bacterium]